MNVLFGVEQTSEGTVFPLGRIHTRVPEKNRNSDDDERGTPMAEDRPPSFIIISFSFSSSFHWFCSLFFLFYEEEEARHGTGRTLCVI